jgi:sigma-B regulation protein RsbU (phosphoserine phosphatase)
MTFEENEVQLEKGDTLFMFTDGESEAVNTQSEEFGYERLGASLEKTAQMTSQQIIDHVKEDLKAFVGEAEQSDDITMLVLKRL